MLYRFVLKLIIDNISNNVPEKWFKSKISVFVHAQFVTCVIVK